MRESFKPPNGALTLREIKSLLKRMPYISGVCIMGLCEPLLNPETPDIIRWLKDEGKYSISFTTNCTVDLDENKLDALTRVDDVALSIDTADPETFRILRGGANLERCMRNVKRIFNFKREKGLGRLDNPPIHVNAVITALNFHQIPDLIKMFEPYAKDLNYLMIDPVTRPDYSLEDPFILQREKFLKHVDEYRTIAKKSPVQVIGFDWMFRESTEWNRCHLSWKGMFIEPNGDAYFCYNYRYVLGNVFKEDPLKIWNNHRAKAFRTQLLSPDPPVQQCHFCNFARTNWQPEGVYYERMEDAEDEVN